MDKLKLRGYTSPEDYTGTPDERFAKAIEVSKEKNIGRVYITGNWCLKETVYLNEQTELLLENAFITFEGSGPLFANRNYRLESTRQWAFQEEWIRITSDNSTINGDLYFENCAHLILDHVNCTGRISLEYVWGTRILNTAFKQFNIHRGCKDLLIRELSTIEDLCMDNSRCDLGLVIAKEPDIKNVIIQDSVLNEGIHLQSSSDAAIYNIQIDGIHSLTLPVTIGSRGEHLPAEQYRNLTAVNLFSKNKKVMPTINNAVKNSYFGESSKGIC